MLLSKDQVRSMQRIAANMDEISSGNHYSESSLQNALEHLKQLQARVTASVTACENALKGMPYSHHDLQDGAIALRLMYCHTAHD